MNIRRILVVTIASFVFGAEAFVDVVVQAKELGAQDSTSAKEYGRLMIACGSGDTQGVRAILRGKERLDLDKPSRGWNDTPLNRSAAQGYVEIVQALLDAGADPNAAGALGERPLVSAAETGHSDVVALLLSRGAQVDAESGPSFVTALERASRYGHTDVVRLLLAAGTNVNRVARGGATALVLAREHGHHDVEALLLSAGASMPSQSPKVRVDPNAHNRTRH